MKFILPMVLSALINFAYGANEIQKVNVTVTNKGFEPSQIKTLQGIEVELEVIRKTNETCATEIIIPSKNIKKELPLNKTVNIKLGKLKKGEITFSCGMDMISGVINVQ